MESDPKKPFYVGIISPRVFSTGGYDIEDPLRAKLKNQISTILNELQEKHQFIIGITGLSNGPEKDFFFLCQEKNIDCNLLLPFQKTDEQYKKLPSDLFPYQASILEKSLSVQYVSDGVYSPRKMFKKHYRLIQDSNAVILIHSIITKYDLLNKSLKKKNVYNIYAD